MTLTHAKPIQADSEPTPNDKLTALSRSCWPQAGTGRDAIILSNVPQTPNYTCFCITCQNLLWIMNFFIKLLYSVQSLTEGVKCIQYTML